MANLGILWIVLLPLFGAIINGMAGRFTSKRVVSVIAVGSVIGSFFLALNVFFDLTDLRAAGSEANLTFDLWRWFELSVPTVHGVTEVPVDVRFVVDELSSVMLLVITGIGSLIHIYSLGYMHDDDGFARYFAYLNLFMASMLILVLASSFPVMFVGWEGVGLCSYLLIGYWYETPAYAAAGRKAFIANRIGDFGVIVGMLALMMVSGSFEFEAINAAAPGMQRPFTLGGAEIGTFATVAGLFIFLGCTGKSAQVPLFVWLPDAMAGPTPVSALIHAATMVTAGVYLCCRISPVLLESSVVLSTIAIVGTLTALIAATIAVVQKEMKKILAYSTVSQLGFMFAAVGVGAFAAGFFHVFTHAFFKACLFLGAGSVMHAVGAHGDANILKLGGMKDRMKVTRWTFLIATAAIAGFPLTAGFFSKDELLFGAASVAMGDVLIPQWVGWFVLVGLFLAATMTAFYMYRLYYLTFTGDYRSAEKAEGGDDHAHDEDEDDAHDDDHDDAHDDAHGHDDHGHGDHGYRPRPKESEISMTFPLMVLAFGALVVGFLGMPHALHLPNWWGGWMSGSMGNLPGMGPHDHVENMTPVYVAMGLGLLAFFIGCGVATVKYRDKNEDTFTTALPKKLYAFLFDKWRFDEFYGATILRFNRGLAVLAGRIDQSFVDALLTKAPAWIAMRLGWLFTRIQVGVVHAYGLVLVVGMFGVGWWFLYPHANVEIDSVGAESANLTVGRGLGYEFRFDLDGDGNFDVPDQPSRVFIDLADDITNQEAMRVVALVRAAIAPTEWPSDRSGLGALIDREHKVYEMAPPTEALPDLRLALERAERVDEVRWENAGEAFGTQTNAELRFDAEDYQGFALVVGVLRGEPDEYELGHEPLLLDESRLGPGWSRAQEDEEEIPVAIWINEDGEVVVKPNSGAVRYRGEAMEEEFTIAAGEAAFFGRAPIRVAPIVETVVEVRNAFGNVDRETIAITLNPAPEATATNSQGARTATQAAARLAEVTR